MVKNIEAEAALSVLTKYLDRTDLLGYAAARNTRFLQDELTEYIAKKNGLVCKYGSADDDGGVSIENGTPEFAEFVKELTPFALLECEPRVFTIDYKHAIGAVSGSDLLVLDFMFKEVDDG